MRLPYLGWQGRQSQCPTWAWKTGRAWLPTRLGGHVSPATSLILSRIPFFLRQIQVQEEEVVVVEAEAEAEEEDLLTVEVLEMLGS